MSLEDIEIYSIVHKETGEIWIARSGKTSWKKSSHAKNAWVQGRGRNEVSHPDFTKEGQYRLSGRYYEKRAKFDEQSVYEIKKVASFTDSQRADRAIALLKEIFPQLTYEQERSSIGAQIKAFLENLDD